MSWTVALQELVEIRPEKYLVKEQTGDQFAGSEKLTRRLPRQIPSGAGPVQKVGTLVLDGPHLPYILSDERRDPSQACFLKVWMFAPKPPEPMGPTGEDSHLGLVGQR